MSPLLSAGKRALTGGLLTASVLLSSPAFGQSAADKATARELASDGIKKFKAGDAAAALKSLKKAQALYDAPIHLLYLARSHAALGELVESAEAYRLLSRSRLAAGAPAVFVQAKADGKKELKELEPRLARLTIEVTPEEVEGLEVTMDGKRVNTAALGVGRATNPGKRTVKASAPGYKPSQAEIELSEGGSETISLELEADPDAEAAPSSAGATDSPGSLSSDDSPTSEKKAPGTSDMGVIAGLRFGGVLPLGQLEKETTFQEYSSAGFGLRAEIGLRFMKHYGVKAYGAFAGLTPGTFFDDLGGGLPQGAVSDNRTATVDFGAAVFATTQLGKFGGFGELGLSLLHNYALTMDVSGTVGSQSIECRNEATYSGWALRAGGGVHIPLNGFINIVPNVDATLGQYTSRSATYGCSGEIGAPLAAALGDEDREIESAMHMQILLGVGGDFHFDL